MRSPLLARLLLAISSLAAHSAIAADGSPLLDQRPCFTQFGSYDQWMDFLWERNNLLGYFALRWTYSEEEFDRYRSELDCRAIRYRSDEHVVLGYIVMPKARAINDPLPVIIFNRGGNGMFGALTLPELLDHVFPLAERGYIVVASQYRGVPGPENGARSPDQFGGDDVHDVTRLIGLVPGMPEADARNVFMLGQSRGAIMTFRALLDSPLPIRAVAIHSGALDMHDLLSFRPEFERLFNALIPNFQTRRKQEMDRRSVTRWPEQLPADTAILIVHGDEDERAPVASARKFAAQLADLGHQHQLIVLEGEPHSLGGARDEVRDTTLAWFRRFERKPQALVPPANQASVRIEP